jgi:PAS domain S-box-containing protein
MLTDRGNSMVVTGYYDPILVALSYVIAVFGSYTALDLAGRARASRGRSAIAWLAGAAAAMGGAIWSMHFVGMLAFIMPMPVAYDMGLTLLSLALPILVTGAGLFSMDRVRSWFIGLSLGGGLMGLGIVAMHYVGMAGMRMAATLSYDPGVVGLSVVIAIVAATAALWLAFRTRHIWQKVVSALVMGLAIVGMHYTAMAAATFTMTDHAQEPNWPALPPTLLATAIALTTFVLLFLALVSAMVDRRLAEAAAREAEVLRQSEHRFRSLIQNAADIIAVLNAEGVFTEISASMERDLNYRPDRLIGQSFLGILMPHSWEAGHALLAQARANPRKPILQILCVQHAGGDGRDVEAIATNLLNEPGIDGIVLNLRDITERKRLQDQLAQASRLATIGTMTAGIAHEMSQPLNIIRLWSDEGLSVIRDGDNNLAPLERILTLISDQTQRMRRIIDHMGLFGRYDSNPVEIFAPTACLQAAVHMVERQYAKEGILIAVDIPSREFLVQGRPLQFEQVLLNLMANARDAIVDTQARDPASEAEPGRIDITIELGNGGASVVVRMSDNGGGIPEKALGQVFDPFFTTKEVGHGSGLGLSISYNLIKSMGGRIKAENISTMSGRRGACLTVTLPTVVPSQTDLRGELMVNSSQMTSGITL